MTTATIRTKVHKYIDEADNDVLEVVYKLLQVYRQSNASVLNESQQKEVLNRSITYKTGKAKVYTVAEARKKLRKRSEK